MSGFITIGKSLTPINPYFFIVNTINGVVSRGRPVWTSQVDSHKKRNTLNERINQCVPVRVWFWRLLI